MSRLKTACPVLAIAAFTLAASFPRASLHAQDKRPNVILIICDDLNDYVEGFGGHPQARTPGISRLSKSGVSFTQAHCNIPTCESSCLTPLFCNAAARSPARRTTSAIEPRLNASSPSSSSSPRTSTLSIVRAQEVFDAAAKAVAPGQWLWDGIHPLPQGQELIARAWLQEVSARWK